jgi:hypothetical protein
MERKDGRRAFYGCELNGPTTGASGERARMLVFCDVPFEAAHGPPTTAGSRVCIIHNDRKFDGACAKFIAVCKLTSELKADTTALAALFAKQPGPVASA